MLQNYFDKYSHKCELDLSKPFNKILRNKCYLRKWFMKHSVISRDYILLRCRPRTFASLRKETLDQLKHFPYALHPFSVIAFWWDVIWLFNVFFWLIRRPLVIFWYLQPEIILDSRGLMIFLGLLQVICIMDCTRRFFTGYLISHSDSDEIVLDFRRVSVHYLKTYFLIDIFPCLAPFIELGLDTNVPVFIAVDIFTFLRLIRLPTMIRVIKNIMRFHHLNHDFIDIFTSILVLCFIVHWVSCFSVLGGLFERKLDQDAFEWYDDIFKPNSTLIYKYIKCYHRTLSILSGTGYLFYLNKTKSINDMIYTIFTAVLGHILKIIIFATIFEIFNGIQSSLNMFVEMEATISNYIKHWHISKTIQNKIKTYHACKYKYKYFNEPKLLATVPISVQQSIFRHTARNLFENISYFNKLPTTVVVNILSLLSKQIVLAGDVIFRSQETGDSIYFLINGTVAEFTYSGQEMSHLEDGSELGQTAIVSDSPTYFCTAVAIETSELLRMHLQDFIALANYYPDLIENVSRKSYNKRDRYEMLEERYQRIYNKRLLLENRISEEPEVVEND